MNVNEVLERLTAENEALAAELDARDAAIKQAEYRQRLLARQAAQQQRAAELARGLRVAEGKRRGGWREYFAMFEEKE